MVTTNSCRDRRKHGRAVQSIISKVLVHANHLLAFPIKVSASLGQKTSLTWHPPARGIAISWFENSSKIRLERIETHREMRLVHMYLSQSRSIHLMTWWASHKAPLELTPNAPAESNYSLLDVSLGTHKLLYGLKSQ